MSPDALDRLISILTPSAEPTFVPSATDWDRVEAELGTRLPGDFRRFVDIYGSGDINDLIGI